MNTILPTDAATLLRKKKQLRRELLELGSSLEIRLAIFGGSTTDELSELLELQLLARGIKPVIYQSAYGQYISDSLNPDPKLKEFKPELVYIHTSHVNITRFPSLSDTVQDVEELFNQQLADFETIWDGIKRELNCPIIQNNFDTPSFFPLGNLDGSDYRGKSRFLSRLNEAFANAAQERPELTISNISHLASRIGLDNWFSARQWYLYRYAMSIDGISLLARQLAAIIAGQYGLCKKCLVLDLDNTLWGGVIGDDGPEGIVIGKHSAEAEAYLSFQHYLLSLKERGILLAVCSKNDETNARLGLMHPDSVLKISDFSCFVANWDNKPENILRIAEELNIGIDTLVFLDDNPSERELVRNTLPQVSTIEPDGDILGFIKAIHDSFLFEATTYTFEDSSRADTYIENTVRNTHKKHFTDYEDFLQSLEMKAIIEPFCDRNAERITQLINKTNQFNLTVKRCNISEIQEISKSNDHIALSAILADKFGDNGLVSAIAGRIDGRVLHIELWIMSCRVFKRGLEYALFSKLIEQAKMRGVNEVIGYYNPSPKNALVSDLYHELGFKIAPRHTQESTWSATIERDIRTPNHHIHITC